MEPLKAELEAMREVLLRPLDSFVTDKDAESRTEEALEALAHKRMFSTAIKAVDAARGERTTHIVVLRHGRGTSTFYTGFGPYATKAQAEKAYVELAKTMAPTACAVVPVRNAAGFASLLESLDAEPEGRGQWAIVKEDAAALKRGWDGKSKTRGQYV